MQPLHSSPGQRVGHVWASGHPGRAGRIERPCADTAKTWPSGKTISRPVARMPELPCAMAPCSIRSAANFKHHQSITVFQDHVNIDGGNNCQGQCRAAGGSASAYCTGPAKHRSCDVPGAYMDAVRLRRPRRKWGRPCQPWRRFKGFKDTPQLTSRTRHQPTRSGSRGGVAPAPGVRPKGREEGAAPPGCLAGLSRKWTTPVPCRLTLPWW